MIKQKLKLLWLAIGVLASFSATADEAEGHFQYSTLQVGAIAALQGGGSTWSGVAKYTPRYVLNPTMSVGLDLGLSYFKRVDSKNFIVLQYIASFDYRVLESYILRAKFGLETWGLEHGTRIAFGPEVACVLPPNSFGLVTEAFVTYLPTLQDPIAHQLIAGLTFQF